MKALWIRVEAHEIDSSHIGRFAAALGVSKVMALGHYTALGGAIAEHTDDGKIHGIDDSLLESWARWTGRGGKLARAVRDTLQGEDGTYSDWTDSMGKLVERRAKDRERKDLAAARRKGTREPADDTFRGTSTAIPRKLHGTSAATGRNGTVRSKAEAEGESTSLGRAASAPASLRSDPSAESLSLPPIAAAFLDRFYPVAGQRRADVAHQREELAAGQVIRDRRVSVSAHGVARLEAKCADVIAEASRLRDPDKAIAVLFTKLGDTTDVSARRIVDEQREVATEERLGDVQEQLATTWANEHPDRAAALHAELAAEFPGDGSFVAQTRQWAFVSRAARLADEPQGPERAMSSAGVPSPHDPETSS